MTLDVQPKALADALSRAMGAVDHNKNYPILSTILMVASGGQLTLRTTDLNVEIATTIECEGELTAICAPADRLQSTIARLVDRGSAQLVMEGALLVITSGRSRFTMPTLDPDAFPTLASKEIGCTFTIEGKQLLALIESCAFAISTGDPRYPTIEGLHLFAGSIRDGSERNLCAVATDGYQFSVRAVAADLPSDFPPIIIPRRSVSIITRMISGWAEISVEVIPGRRMILAVGHTRFITKLMEGAYIDWRRVVPNVEPVLSYDSEFLSAAVANAYSAVRADKKHGGMALTFADDETAFRIANIDGTATGSDACPHSLLADEHPTAALGVNPPFLLSIIDALSAETVQFAFHDTASPALITTPNFTDRFAIIMPMRV